MRISLNMEQEYHISTRMRTTCLTSNRMNKQTNKKQKNRGCMEKTRSLQCPNKIWNCFPFAKRSSAQWIGPVSCLPFLLSVCCIRSHSIVYCNSEAEGRRPDSALFSWYSMGESIDSLCWMGNIIQWARLVTASQESKTAQLASANNVIELRLYSGHRHWPIPHSHTNGNAGSWPPRRNKRCKWHV